MDMLERIEAAGRMEEADVAVLRRAVYGDVMGKERVTREDVARVAAFLDAAPEGCTDWRWFLRDLFEDHFLRQSEPLNYFTDEGAATLLAITAPGNRTNRLRTHVLVHLLTKCMAAPRSLATRAMELLEGDVLADHRICAEDVREVRRLLHAQGSFNGIAICRSEADFLFDLNDHAGEDADPSWSDLFSKAIANHLMGAGGWRAPDREEALRQEIWLKDTSVDVGGFFGRMATGLFEGFGRRDRECQWERRNADRERWEGSEGRISKAEAEWLAGRIARDGRFCDAERAMIAYVRGLAEVDLPAVLEPYLLAA